MINLEPALLYRELLGNREPEDISLVPENRYTIGDNAASGATVQVLTPVSEVTSDEIDPAELREAKSYEEQLSEYVFSASSMEMALECPFKFYVQKMLGLYAETVPEKSYDSWLAPNDFGTLCHEVLSRYYTEPDTDWHNLLSEEVEKMKELQPEGPPSAVAAEIREAERMISRAIDWTNAQGRTVIATEYGFGPKAGTEPLALEINGKTIRLSGSNPFWIIRPENRNTTETIWRQSSSRTCIHRRQRSSTRS